MKWFAIAAGILTVSAVGYAVYMTQFANPRIVQGLRDDPHGELAEKVMLLTLPSGKAIPVNYLREGDVVYAAADGPWWRELRDGGGRGSVLVKGETLHGSVRAVRDDPELRDAVFERLRPTAPRMFGTMIVVDLEPRSGVLPGNE